jgi:hypothetical protein
LHCESGRTGRRRAKENAFRVRMFARHRGAMIKIEHRENPYFIGIFVQSENSYDKSRGAKIISRVIARASRAGVASRRRRRRLHTKCCGVSINFFLL